MKRRMSYQAPLLVPERVPSDALKRLTVSRVTNPGSQLVR
jgi:hypothetical protein